MTAKQELSNWLQKHSALESPADREQFRQQILGELATKDSDWHHDGLVALRESAHEIRVKAEALFARHKDLIPYHSSYLLAQQDNITAKIQQLHLTHPDMSLTKVVTTILAELPENMAPRLVRELTLFTIETWERVASEEIATASAA